MEPNIQLDSILQLWAVQTKDDFFRLNSEMLNTQAGSKQVNKNARVREGMMIEFGLIHLLEVNVHDVHVYE